MAKRSAYEQKVYERNKALMYQRDGWKCRCCRSRNNLTPHHVVYQSHGGTDDLFNLLTLCIRCHDDAHGGRICIEVVALLAADLVVKFLEHLAAIRTAINAQGLWNDRDGLFYDRLVTPDGTAVPVEVR